MKIKPRRIKQYTPRRRKYSKDLQKQQLEDFEQILNMDLGTFLILNEEGTKKQMHQARAKMRSDLLKYGKDMEKIARDVGDNYFELVQNFVKSLSRIANDVSDEIAPAPILEHHKISENLIRLLKERLPPKAA